MAHQATHENICLLSYLRRRRSTGGGAPRRRTPRPPCCMRSHRRCRRSLKQIIMTSKAEETTMSSHGSDARVGIFSLHGAGSGDAESKRGAGHNVIAGEAACSVTNKNHNTHTHRVRRVSRPTVTSSERCKKTPRPRAVDSVVTRLITKNRTSPFINPINTTDFDLLH